MPGYTPESEQAKEGMSKRLRSLRRRDEERTTVVGKGSEKREEAVISKDGDIEKRRHVRRKLAGNESRHMGPAGRAAAKASSEGHEIQRAAISGMGATHSQSQSSLHERVLVIVSNKDFGNGSNTQSESVQLARKGSSGWVGNSIRTMKIGVKPCRTGEARRLWRTLEAGCGAGLSLIERVVTPLKSRGLRLAEGVGGEGGGRRERFLPRSDDDSDLGLLWPEPPTSQLDNAVATSANNSVHKSPSLAPPSPRRAHHPLNMNLIHHVQYWRIRFFLMNEESVKNMFDAARKLLGLRMWAMRLASASTNGFGVQ
ncbi:hypothetical protein FB45DRAFT_1000013 [Roridomyces roridus]|uniref:Uncharacterized protein n=1 Tax=Roridomyces roridus TaxID=1738132 RepID=A0AAD7C7F4_9AGAR|nr:hypothetical protein FB45DRAFT_1000013 [Roridomyces roridus]